MYEDNIPHFSKKILLLSMMFLLLNVAWYTLTVLGQSGVQYKEVAPKLLFAESQDVELKTIYDDEYHLAVPSQVVLGGTKIKTTELEYAEIVLDKNVIRLDENTEVLFTENNFNEYSAYRTDTPRLSFKLISGSVWVNAFDTVEINTKRSSTEFAHSIGVLTYNEPMNRLVVISGTSDLILKDEAGNDLIDYSIPLNNQVTYTDSQIIDDYALLRNSKLKKELKLAPIVQAIYEDEWVIRNSKVDSELENLKNEFIYSGFIYSLKDRYYKIKSYLTYIPSAKRSLALNHTKDMLYYLLGGINKNEDNAKAEEIISELLVQVNEMAGDPLMKNFLTETYFAIGYVPVSSPANLVKDTLLDYLLKQEGANVLRAYLSDVRSALDEFSLKDSEEISAKWMDSWNSFSVSRDIDEFTNQSQILHRIILSYADRTTKDLMDIMDQTGDIRLENTDAKDIEEARFDITEERLEIASMLVANYRYIAAKQYLKKSYESLNIDEMDTSVAAKEIFLDKAEVLAQRIEYAQERMHGAAKPIDEEDFQDFMAMKARDELLSNNLKVFLEVGIEEVEIEPPTVEEVVDSFAEARISIMSEYISPQQDFLFSFDVKNARLIDRSEDGSIVSFDATYDSTTNAITDVILNDTPLNGHFDLNDISSIFLTVELVSEEPEDNSLIDDISGLLNGDNDEALRAQITAQTLSKKLAQNQLSTAGIIVETLDQIEVLDIVTLTDFRITNGYVQNPNDPETPITVQFDYSSLTKRVSTVYFEERLIVPGGIDINSFKNVLLSDAVPAAKKQSDILDFVAKVEADGGLINFEDVLSYDAGIITFDKLHTATLPISVSGVYDTHINVYLLLSHDLYDASNVSLEKYFSQIGMQYIVDYLKQSNMSVESNQIQTKYPYETIKINNYSVGSNSFSFLLDIMSNKLRDIVNNDTGDKIGTLTVTEFSRITSD